MKNSISIVLFKAIDVLCHPGQNYKKFPTVTCEKDLVYDAEHPDICKGDIYYDKKFAADGKYPVIMNIHGGGFVAGGKKHRVSIGGLYASRGYFVWNIDYHFAQQKTFPQQAFDCINALNYLKEFEEKYNLDLNRVIITGDSAGAYYATYTVAAEKNIELRETFALPEFKVHIAGLAAFCGVYDLELALTHKLPFNLIWDMGRLLLGIEFEKDFSDLNRYPYVRQLSPKYYVTDDWCPTFLSMAAEDFFCKGQGEDFLARLEARNIPTSHFRSLKFSQNHCFHMEFFKKISKECFKVMFEFMDKIKNSEF